MAIEDFIAARIYDDEQTAQAAAPWSLVDTVEAAERDGALDRAEHEAQLGFVAQWDPARVLLECKAKRGILLEWMTQRRRAEVDRTIPGPSPLVLQYLALTWRYHPDYLPAAWTPPEPGTVETWGRR
jgi:hypothetical protein